MLGAETPFHSILAQRKTAVAILPAGCTRRQTPSAFVTVMIQRYSGFLSGPIRAISVGRSARKNSTSDPYDAFADSHAFIVARRGQHRRSPRFPGGSSGIEFERRLGVSSRQIAGKRLENGGDSLRFSGPRRPRLARP